VRLGTRGSALALAQAEWVAARLPGEVEVVPITTTGDRDRAREDKAKWVRELERALLAGEVDLAVHSAKDVPSELPDGLALAGAPEREDPRDVLVGRLAGRVGTSSPRRAAMLRAFHPAVDVVEVRGNVDTRLRKLASGELDGLVLAAAGLRRLGRPEEAEPLDFVPAAGQGTLLLEARAGGPPVLRDPAAWAAVTCERACVRALRADCHSAVGIHHDGALLRGWVGAEDGSAWIADALEGPASEQLGLQLAERLLAAGARDLL
jgi:hydroxymethylbilane synthase